MENLKDGYISDYVSGLQVRITPEEIEAVQPFLHKLVDDYGYPKENIVTHPQYRVKARPSDVKKEYPVDIAVFADSKHKDDDCYLIVECKKKKRRDGKEQLEDYLRFSKASLGVWYNGKETLYLRKYEQGGYVKFIEIPNIPIYGQRVEDVGLFRRCDLKKTHNLKSVFGSIRNYLAANNTGITLDNEFVVQIINIIFCKIYDERFTRAKDIVSFRAGIEEPRRDIASRIKKLFCSVKSKYPDVFDNSDNISLTDSSIAYIVGELQQYCLIESERDVIADAFEIFISPSLRGGQGQFFTPRNVVRLLVALTNPSSHKYIMNYVESKAQIEAVISMPEELFQPHTHAKTCVVLMRKLSAGEKINKNSDIFMAVAKWCGHDSRGLAIPYDDIPAIQERFEKFKAGEQLEYDHLGFAIKYSQVINSIYLPIYYNPEIQHGLNLLKSEYNLVTIAELVDQGLISISNGDEVGKLAYGTGNIPFIRTSDIANWEIKLDPKQGLSKDIYDSLRDKQDVQACDILMVKDGTYLVGTCAMVTELETKIVYQSHLWKIRSLDHDKLNPYLLLALLSSPIVKQQIRAKQFTQDIIDTIGKRINELVLPFPKDKNQEARIIEKVQRVFEKRTEAKSIMREILLNVTPVHDYDNENPFLTLL